MGSMIRLKDKDETNENPSFSNKRVIIDKYPAFYDINFTCEAEFLYSYLKTVCSKELFEAIKKKFNETKG